MNSEVFGLLIFLGLMSYSVISISSALRLWSMRNGSQTRFVSWLSLLMFGISFHGLLGVYTLVATKSFDFISLLRELSLTVPAWVVALNLSSIRRDRIKLSAHRTALIVEDNAGQARLLTELVKESGLSAVVCESAERAIAMLQTDNYPVTFIDVRLSGKLSGLELIEWIYANSIKTHPVIVLTEVDDLKKHPNLPATIIMLKPMNLEKIQSVISRL